ncbi:MAG: hypothetical protein ACR2KX_18625 [Chitinophagaceae bacterium]
MKYLTRMMRETLMECHERELLSLPPISVNETMHLKGLYARGLVEPRIYKNESGNGIIAFYVTKAGQVYLESLK